MQDKQDQKTRSNVFLQSSEFLKDSKFTNSFTSFKKASVANPDDYICIDKDTWNDVEEKVKYMISDLELLTKENKRLEEALTLNQKENNQTISSLNSKISVLRKELQDKEELINNEKADKARLTVLEKENESLSVKTNKLEMQIKGLIKLNERLERDIEKDRTEWKEYQKLSEIELQETRERLEKEKEEIEIKFRSERQFITQSVKKKVKKDSRLSLGKMLVIEKQNEILESELSYYKNKLNDASKDRELMEKRVESYREQLKIILDCIYNLEEKYRLTESDIIKDNGFEKLKEQIRFNF